MGASALKIKNNKKYKKYYGIRARLSNNFNYVEQQGQLFWITVIARCEMLSWRLRM